MKHPAASALVKAPLVIAGAKAAGVAQIAIAWVAPQRHNIVPLFGPGVARNQMKHSAHEMYDVDAR